MLVYVTQKMKFNQYLADQKIGYFFMERPPPQVSSVNMTNPLANYKSNSNINVKFYNRLSVLEKNLSLNKWE